jgi:hypothetical protein
MKPTTRTTVMDAEPAKAQARIDIQRHPTDMHTLSDDVGNRIVATLKRNQAGCVYFNPAVTVSCPSPTTGFFQVIAKEQGRWCRQARDGFAKKARRSASSWVGGGDLFDHKFARYLDRALCFTGVLFIDGQLVLPHNWPVTDARQAGQDQPNPVA